MITLSYIICTKNRLPFLKILIGHLLPRLKPGEEVVVVDGNSTDGTREYLEGLFTANKIHQYSSGPDKNQAHGWNKAMLMAKGLLIKKLTDDDVYDYDAINACKEFMLAHPDIDICISDCLQSYLNDPHKIEMASRKENYLKWMAGGTHVFTFSDVYMLIRRSSLSYLGLYDTQFKMIDWEYALRVTHLKANIAYYTGCNSLSVSTPGNVTSTATIKLLQHEAAVGKAKYAYAGDDAGISLYSRLKVWIGVSYHRFKTKDKPVDTAPLNETQLLNIYTKFYQELEHYNKTRSFDFFK